MTGPVRKLYEAALRDRAFNEEAKKADPQGYKKPTLWSDSLLKHIYATTYFGWLVGKGLFKRSTFY
jgi:hypothetical protein